MIVTYWRRATRTWYLGHLPLVVLRGLCDRRTVYGGRP